MTPESYWIRDEDRGGYREANSGQFVPDCVLERAGFHEQVLYCQRRYGAQRACELREQLLTAYARGGLCGEPPRTVPCGCCFGAGHMVTDDWDCRSVRCLICGGSGKWEEKVSHEPGR